jgi:ABC-type uncharacterized transport system ATPase subunit
LHLELREPIASATLAALTDPLPVRWAEHDGTEHLALFSRLEVTAAEVIQNVIDRYSVSDLRITEPDIENVVRQIYKNGSVLPSRGVAAEPESSHAGHMRDASDG